LNWDLLDWNVPFEYKEFKIINGMLTKYPMNKMVNLMDGIGTYLINVSVTLLGRATTILLFVLWVKKGDKRALRA